MENKKEIKNKETKSIDLLSDLFELSEEEIQKMKKEHSAQVKKNPINEDFVKLLSCLEPKERALLRLRFGMDDGRKRTLEEVGILFGVDATRIRQIEEKALKKLKQLAENK